MVDYGDGNNEKPLPIGFVIATLVFLLLVVGGAWLTSYDVERESEELDALLREWAERAKPIQGELSGVSWPSGPRSNLHSALKKYLPLKAPKGQHDVLLLSGKTPNKVALNHWSLPDIRRARSFAEAKLVISGYYDELVEEETPLRERTRYAYVWLRDEGLHGLVCFSYKKPSSTFVGYTRKTVRQPFRGNRHYRVPKFIEGRDWSTGERCHSYFWEDAGFTGEWIVDRVD